MLKKKIINKLLICFSSILLLFILYLFPKSNTVKTIETNKYDIIYLLNNNNYVSRVNTIYKSNNNINKVKEIINTLTIDSNIYIRNNFNKIIPKNTKLLSVSIDNNICKLNFSKEFLNIDKDKSELMIESIVYSITELDNIKFVSIYIEGSILDKYPNTNIKINELLNRNIGINKIYNITNIKNVTSTTIYYLSKYNDYYYYIPVTKISNENLSKIEIIINELSSNNIIGTNLLSYLNNSVELLSYNEYDKTLILNFNEYIFNDINRKNILENVSYSINLSIKDNYDINEVIYYVNDELIKNYSI